MPGTGVHPRTGGGAIPFDALPLWYSGLTVHASGPIEEGDAAKFAIKPFDRAYRDNVQNLSHFQD